MPKAVLRRFKNIDKKIFFVVGNRKRDKFERNSRLVILRYHNTYIPYTLKYFLKSNDLFIKVLNL